MTGFRIRIVVKGRVGPNVRSVLAGLDAAVTPRHTMFVLAPSEFPELLAALGVLHRRGVEVDRISNLARFVEYPTRIELQARRDAAG